MTGEPARSGGGRLFGAASLMAAGNVASRVLGLVRQQVIAGLYGNTLQAQALAAALRVPTMIYDLLVGGMLTAALVPVLSGYASTRRSELWRAISVITSGVGVVTGSVALLLYVLSGPVAGLLAGGLGPEGEAMVATSLRWLSPAVAAFGLAGALTGALYALERFARPAATGAVYNLAMIATVLMLHDRLGPYAVPLGVTVGGCAQVLLLVPGLRDGRLRPTLDFRHPVVRRVLVLYAPVAAGLIVTQMQVAIDTNLAARTPRGLSVMVYATNLIQFPHGLVAVAISIAILPTLSAAHARGDPGTYATTLARGVRAVLALTLPAAVGLAVLAEPVVGAVFQRGAFGAADRMLVELALLGYVVGLPFAAADWPLNAGFYARGDTLTPTLVGVFSVLVYLAVAIAIGPILNVTGLAPSVLFLGLVLADSAKQASHLAAMAWLTRRRVGPAGLEGVARTSWAAGAAALAMGAVVLLVDRALASALGAGTLSWVARAAIGAAVGAAVYMPLAARLGVPEIAWLVQVARTRALPGR
jgi:putative peptidoglycan lipid II flippase